MHESSFSNHLLADHLRGRHIISHSKLQDLMAAMRQLLNTVALDKQSHTDLLTMIDALPAAVRVERVVAKLHRHQHRFVFDSSQLADIEKNIVPSTIFMIISKKQHGRQEKLRLQTRVVVFASIKTRSVVRVNHGHCCISLLYFQVLQDGSQSNQPRKLHKIGGSRLLPKNSVGAAGTQNLPLLKTEIKADS